MEPVGRKKIKIEIEKNRKLKDYNSWKVGGTAQFYCAPENLEELKQVLIHAKKNHWDYSILGGGTNTLISDEGVRGLVIHTHKLKGVETFVTEQKVVIEALAGTLKSDVLKVFLKHRLWPAVFLAGLPGDMAGGVVMNAGVGHKVIPREFVEIVESFDVITFGTKGNLEQRTFQKKDIQWFYRQSQGWQPGVISSVKVGWVNEPDDGVLKALREANQRRKKSQPLNHSNCGSVFKNPESGHAGQWIEDAGLKGLSVGDAQVSEKHANFIINRGNATACDIHSLMEKVRAQVFEKFQIQLVSEVVYLGRWQR